ncbi:P-loop containing nucleoside triphosphate hydrolase protein [Hortaea werneckii]|nr:P-loop containing nucleoside triphosphate hydrolase protein [Hortaea werneckii]
MKNLLVTTRLLRLSLVFGEVNAAVFHTIGLVLDERRPFGHRSRSRSVEGCLACCKNGISRHAWVLEVVTPVPLPQHGRRLEDDLGTRFTHYLVDELESFGRDSRAMLSALGIVERQACRALAGSLLLGELLYSDFTLRLHVTRHGDHEVRHEAQDGVLRCVDRTRHVQAAAVQDLDSGFRHVEPHALGKDDDRRVVDLHGVQDPALLVDLEEAEDVLQDFDGAEESSTQAPWYASDHLRLDRIDVREVTLLRCPVNLDVFDLCNHTVGRHFFDQVSATLMEEYASFNDISVPGCGVDNSEVTLFSVTNSDCAGRMGQKTFVDFGELLAKVFVVLVGTDRHLVRCALYVTLQNQHVGQVYLQLAIWLREDFVRVLHEVLLEGIGANNTHELTVKHLLLNLPSILRSVPTSVRHHPIHHLISLQRVQLSFDSSSQNLALFPHPAECNDPDASQDELTKQPRCLRERISSSTRGISWILKRRVPAKKLLSSAWTPIKVHEGDIFFQPKQRPHVLLRIRDRRRARYELDLPTWSSSMTTYRKFWRNERHASSCGRIVRCNMSGFVKMIRASSRMVLRSDMGVSPSKVSHMTCSKPGSREDVHGPSLETREMREIRRRLLEDRKRDGHLERFVQCTTLRT